jgi:hypothetical protein
MGNRSFSRTLAAWMVTLLFFGTLLGGVHARSPEGAASARTTDDEPANNSPNTAPELTMDEVIYGSIMTTSTTDYFDVYHTSLPYEKVINASMHILNWNPADPGEVNFQLQLYTVSQGNLVQIAGYDNTGSYNPTRYTPWENVNFFQIYTQAAMDIWVVIQVNLTAPPNPAVASQAGTYALSVSMSDPIPLSNGQVTGSMDRRNGPDGGYWYKLTTPIADNKMAIGKLQCPVNGDFDIYVYNMWPRYDHPDLPIPVRWQVNASWTNASLGNVEEVHVGGSESTAMYVEIRAFDGGGAFTLYWDQTTTPATDDNNIPTKATLIRDNYPHAEYADQGIDSVDWWKVTAKAGKSIPEFFFTLTSSASNNQFAMFIFDKDMNFKACKYNTQTGGWPNFGQTNPNPIMNSISIKNTVVGYDGPIYICIQALVHWYGGSEGAVFIPSKGDYKMTFTLPNDPPIFNGPLPEQHLLEDGTLETLVLANYFSDPDGDALTYSVVGSSYNTRPVVDNQTGLVKFSPIANWSGTETVRFRVTDDGPGNKFFDANVSVIVDPVNDPPFLVASIPDDSIKENDIIYTPDLTTIFRDIDNQLTDLKFNLKVVASNTHPPASALPYQYDSASRSYKLGPCNLFYGSYDVQVTCTDGVTGTVPVATSFKVNVAHINHRPTLRENIADPMELTIKEHEKDDHLALADLFVDVDVPEDYANDALTYTVAGEQRLLVSITDDGYLVIDTGKEQYIPGNHYEEKLVITAKDRAGLKATLNMTVFIDPVNDPPRIVNSMPVEDDLEISENTRKLFSVTAVDDDSQDKLTYNWYVNGKKDKNSKGLTFAFEPDYDTGGNVYTIKVDVFDGTTTVTHEWNVTVLDVNRLPTGFIKSPLNMTKFKKGTMVVFQADGTDPDTGDVLTFIWRDANGVELGRGTTLSTDKLPKGTQTITLETNDSKGATFQTVTIIVWAPAAPPSSTPGFEGAFAMAAIGVVLLLGAIRKLKQRA